MLNRTERFKILQHIGTCCTLGCFPAVVDLPSWQLLEQPGRRKWRSLAYFGLFVLHVLYKIGTLARACLEQNTPLYQLIIHAVLGLAPPFLIYWYYQLFIKHPAAFRSFLWLTLTGNIGVTGTMIGEGRARTKCLSRLKEYTTQDLLALSVPYMTWLVAIAVTGTYLYYPTIQLLLYAGLPKMSQNWFSFSVLLLEELRYLLMCCSMAIPVWTLQVISFDLIGTQLKLLISSLRRTRNQRAFQRTYNSLRIIQVYIGIVNTVNRHIIFSWKFLCIAISIGTGYAAIAHFDDYPIFGVMYYLFVVDCTFVYTVSYGKAFRIPELFKEASDQALLGLRKGILRDVQVLKKQMRSIPPIWIKVGEFHVLERESTPTFADYVLSNIVNMLVAFKH